MFFSEIISLLVLILGFIFFYVYTLGVSKGRSWGSNGILFGFTEGIKEVTVTNFTIDIPLKRVILHVAISHDNIGYYKFMFTLPYKVKKILDDSTEWEFNNKKSGSIIYTSYNINEEDIKQSKIRQLKIHVEIEDEIAMKHYGNYFVYLPFGSPLSDDVSEAIVAPIINNKSISLLINLTIPSKAVITSSPNIKKISYRKNGKREFQTLNIETEDLNPIIVQYIIPGEVSKYQKYLFFSGLLIGCGLPSFLYFLGKLFNS